MKSLTALLTIAFVSTLSLSAEQKLWTWKPTSNADARALLATTMAKDGSGAFVLGETKIISKPLSGPVGNSSYLLLWLNAKGKPIMAQSVKTDEDYYTVQNLNGRASWKVCLMGPDKLAFYDDVTLRIYTRKDGKVTLNKIPVAGNTGIGLFTTASFDGWLAHKVVQSGTFKTADPEGGPDVVNPQYDVESLSAWKP